MEHIITRRRGFRKLLAFLLCMASILGLLPAQAFAMSVGQTASSGLGDQYVGLSLIHISIENLQATLEATKGAAEKPSLTGALKENAGKVKEQPAKPAPSKNEQAR